MMKNDKVSEEQIRHNQSLQKWYPLGQIDALWTLLETLYSRFGREYKKELEAVFDSLQILDDKIRADYYPLKKKKR